MIQVRRAIGRLYYVAEYYGTLAVGFSASEALAKMRRFIDKAGGDSGRIGVLFYV